MGFKINRTDVTLMQILQNQKADNASFGMTIAEIMYYMNDIDSGKSRMTIYRRLRMLSESGAMIIGLSKDGIDKLLSDNIFAPLQNDKVCGNIGIIHSGRNDVDIDTLVAEVGKPLNISEGWNGKGTLIAVSGLSFPLDHVTRLGKLAIEGQKERQRNVEAAKNQLLPSLDFGEVAKPVKKTVTKEKPKLKGRDALLAMRKANS